MKIYLLILFGLWSSCKAQKPIAANNQPLKLQFYADSCNRFYDYTRTRVSDSVFVERHNNIQDTLVLTAGKLYKINVGVVYKIIDVDEDFGSSSKISHYYYNNLPANDTTQRDRETVLQYKLRLTQNIVVFMPVKKMKIKDRELFVYYIIADCYPASDEKCIQSKIINGAYSEIYFERNIGYVGYTAGASKCNFMITDESHAILSGQRK